MLFLLDGSRLSPIRSVLAHRRMSQAFPKVSIRLHRADPLVAVSGQGQEPRYWDHRPCRRKNLLITL
jgi:hypothetical protein